MQISEQHQSQIAEEEHINITRMRKKQQPVNPQKLKYASVSEIRSFERSAQIYNQKMIESRPLLFSEQSLSSVLPIRFESSAIGQIYTLGDRKEETKDILEVQQDKLTLKLGVSNIRRENNLTLVIKNLKKKAVIQLQSIPTNNQQSTVKFKYTMNLNDTNLLLRVLVQLQAEYKVWKEVEVPLTQNKFTIEINQYNNQQTDIKINQFLFHLLLKMPYHEQINYCLLHHGNAQVQKVQFLSKPQKKQVQSRQTYCSKECQLI